MFKGYTITNDGPFTVSAPAGAYVTVIYGERRSKTPRRGTISALMMGRRKASFDRRIVNGVCRFTFVDYPTERRVTTKQRRVRGNYTIHGTWLINRRVMLLDRKGFNFGRRAGDAAAHKERRDPKRVGGPLPRWSESAKAWVPTITLRRRKEDERRSIIPRRVTICRPIMEGAVYGAQMVGKRKAFLDRRTVNGARRAVSADCPTERRDPSRNMYQYRTSHDPRIQALERRSAKPSTRPPRWNESAGAWVPTNERRSGMDRRGLTSTPEKLRRHGQRRKV